MEITEKAPGPLLTRRRRIALLQLELGEERHCDETDGLSFAKFGRSHDMRAQRRSKILRGMGLI